MKKTTLIWLFLTAILAVPTWAFAKLTPTYDDISIPMRDGKFLEADVYIPSNVDSAEVILIQTPYNKDLFEWGMPMGVGEQIDNFSYIWVVVDWRGFYGSKDAASANVVRGEDAYDVCDWIAAQNWHKDKIATWGPSALGGVQYNLCAENHPNHHCAIPVVATGSQAYESYFYGGVLEEARLNQLDKLGYGLSPIILANVYDNAIWTAAATGSDFTDDIRIPTLQIGGWYDHNIDQMMSFYTKARSAAAVNVRDEQWLLVGPWVHGGTGIASVGTSVQGELTYPSAAFKNNEMSLDFLAYYLLDSANGWNQTPKITYYDMGGSSGWLTTNQDDIHHSGTDVLYLNSFNGLSPSQSFDSTSFISDPANPSPTLGGATLSDLLDQGPYDQNSLDQRTDIAFFTSSVLSSDVSVTGRIVLELYISSDQPDCDIAVRLADLYPDGRSMLITDGIKRMRFRGNSYSQNDEEFMEEGEVYMVEVELPFVQYTWKAGHKVKIYLSGNNAPRFHVNLQDGGEMYKSGSGNTARISVHHSPEYPSQLILPGDNQSLSADRPLIDKIGLYPNPSSGVLHIQNVNLLSAYRLQSSDGRFLSNEHAMQGSSIDLSEYPAGIYFLHLKTREGQLVLQKLILY